MIGPIRNLANNFERPEAMGLVCALVYLLGIIAFLPLAFKRHIVEVTSLADNKDRVLEAYDLENGRFLHRFPLEKVGAHIMFFRSATALTLLACFLWLRVWYPGLTDHPGNPRRFF